MKHVHKFLAASVALALIGCGGTGGNSKPATGPVLNINPRVEAIVAVQRTNLMHPDMWTDQQLQDPTNMAVKADLFDQTVFGVVDPTNVATGEQVIFQLVNYTTDSSGNPVRHIIPGVVFTTSDFNSTYGVLASNTGQLTVSNNATSQPIFVTASYTGGTFSAEYDIKIRQVRLLGNVLDENTNQAAALAGCQVQFYNAANALVDTVTVAFDGSFRASVPTNTTSFTVNGDSLPSSYYHSFTYNTLRYDASVVSCFAPAPSGLQVGTTTLPGTILVTPRVNGVPTPSSTGCQQGPVTKH